LELPEPAVDGNIYVVSWQAALLMRVAPCTISRWQRKGYLHPIPQSPPHRPIYLWEDVITAEHEARKAAMKASGTTKQVQRNRKVPDD